MKDEVKKRPIKESSQEPGANAATAVATDKNNSPGEKRRKEQSSSSEASSYCAPDRTKNTNQQKRPRGRPPRGEQSDQQKCPKQQAYEIVYDEATKKAVGKKDANGTFYPYKKRGRIPGTGSTTTSQAKNLGLAVKVKCPRGKKFDEEEQAAGGS